MSSGACDCAWCAGRTRTTLPLVFRIHFRDHLACWGWVLDVNRQRCAVLTGTKYEIVTGLRRVVRHCAGLFSATFTESQIDQIAASGVSVAWNGTAVPWRDVPISLSPVAAPVPDRAGTALCDRSVPPMALRAPTAPKAPRRPTASKRPCHRPSPTKEERAPSPMLVEIPAEAYDLRRLGGNEVDVREAHATRPVWDAEIVMEMLRHGAHPPLKEIRKVVQRPHHREAQCVFIQPSGAATPSIFLPMSIVLSEYPVAAQPYVR